MKLHPLLATMVLTVAGVTVAHGENDHACTGLESALQRPPGGNLPESVLKRIQATAQRMEALSVPSGVDCSDVGKVLGRLVSGSVKGGKKLHGDLPFDTAKAQTELAEALEQNTELKAQLERLRGMVAEEQERLLYEAALFHSNSLYGARDLRLQQFIQLAKGG